MAEPVALGMNTWELYVTDRTGTRQVALDCYETGELIARTNDVSTWEVTLPTDCPAGEIFLSDTFARLEVAVNGMIWRSGPVSQVKRDVDLDGDMLTVSGVDDTVWLARRNAHPQPGTPAPPYNLTAHDVHTGNVAAVLAGLVDVNLGPSAVAARQVPGLAVPTPSPAGPTITVNARWQNLLTIMQDTARPYDILFEIVDLTFNARMAVNRGAVFSEGLETLAGWSMTSEAADANKVVVAGGGELTERLIREASDPASIAQWGLAETFQDRRDTTDTDEMDKAAQETLADSVHPVTVTFTPVDTEAQEFARDWWLGDIVTVIVGGFTIVDQIREVHVTLDDKGVTIVPSVGKATGDLALFRQLALLAKRLRQLERI